MDELPYAIMCELRAIAGDKPSTNLRLIGARRPTPEAMHFRRGHHRPISPAMPSTPPTEPESKYEYSASLQDLVDFGLLEHGFWHDGDHEATAYGFRLTEKAMKALIPSPSSQVRGQ